MHSRHLGSFQWPMPVVVVAAFGLMVSAASSASAQNGNHSECAGLQGGAFGLCVAFCEAQNCDEVPRPSCEVLRRNFERMTGSSVFPCEEAVTPTETATAAATATDTPEPTATDTAVPTATDTAEPTATDTPEPTSTDTPEPTATDTALPTATATFTGTVAATATDTPEPTSTDTPEPTSTDTPEPTSTDTPVPTSTDTPVPTSTDTPVPTSTDTPLPTATATFTGTAAATVTNTPEATSTDTPEPTATATFTGTVAATATDTPEPTATDTAPPAATATDTPVPTATDTAVPTPTDTPTATEEPTATTTPEPTCPLDEGRYTITTTGGTLRVATFAPFAFPAGGMTIQDVGPGDAECIHETVIPFPGGLTVPVFCVPALGATTSVTQSGCGIGLIDSDGGSDFTVNELGDTSEAAVCNVAQAVCPAAGPAPDSSGRLDITVGDGTPDTCASGGTANAIVTIPVDTLTWVDADGACPDEDGMFDPGTDTLLAQFPQTLDLTTDTNTAQFSDIDGDGCLRSGLGPTGPFSNTGQCIDLTANTVNIAASGTIFSSGGPTYDLLFTTVQNNTISGPSAPGGATCDTPPLINFDGSATRCLVEP